MIDANKPVATLVPFDALLPEECRARGCQAAHGYLIRNLADGAVHWDPNTKRGAGLMVDSIFSLFVNQDVFARFVADLAERAHGPDADDLSLPGSVSFAEWPAVVETVAATNSFKAWPE